MKSVDVVVIGAGAAGLFAAIYAAKRGRKVVVIEHARKVGRKILMSGGGRCNFTNMYTEPENFLSNNPHFCKSALSQYTQWDFIDLVNRHEVSYHEKTLGQLFCDHSAKDIVGLLLKECEKANVDIQTRTHVDSIDYVGEHFHTKLDGRTIKSESMIIATGGMSIPSMGPHGFGYKIAKQFGLKVLPCSAALVPFVMDETWLSHYKELAGTTLPEVVASNRLAGFKEGLLFTHKGLSGPSILQISSYWRPSEAIEINLLPHVDAAKDLMSIKRTEPKLTLRHWINRFFSRRLSELLCQYEFRNTALQEYSDQSLQEIGERINAFSVMPKSTEGYKTAEVTLGGVDTDALSSSTMMVKSVPGLFFIGEVVDVTGHLGGYNFQWAWSSGWVAGQNA